MAVLGRYTKFLIDEFDFSGDSNALSTNPTVNALDATGFQQDGMRYKPGLAAGNLSQNGFYAGKGAGEIEQELHSRLGTTSAVYVAAIYGTNQTKPCAYVLEDTWGDQLEIDMPVAELITLSSEWPQSNQFRRGHVVFDGTIDATGGQASVDFGAQGAAGGTAYLFVTGITGSATDATIDIESSGTDAFAGEEASEGTFTFSAVGVVKVALTGTVDRYIRINCTSLGGATDFDVIAIVCIDGVTQ